MQLSVKQTRKKIRPQDHTQARHGAYPLVHLKYIIMKQRVLNTCYFSFADLCFQSDPFNSFREASCAEKVHCSSLFFVSPLFFPFFPLPQILSQSTAMDSYKCTGGTFHSHCWYSWLQWELRGGRNPITSRKTLRKFVRTSLFWSNKQMWWLVFGRSEHV